LRGAPACSAKLPANRRAAFPPQAGQAPVLTALAYRLGPT
jgi:hypothetical protein